MKAIPCAIILVISCVLYAYCSPVDVSSVAEAETGVEHIRVKRVTCDLLSFEFGGFKLNEAACAAHCLSKRKRGGYCTKRRICHCR